MIAKLKDLWTNKRTVVLIGAPVILVLLLGITYASVELTSTVGFCTSCHEMGPAYASYLQSSHYRTHSGTPVTCRQCHVPPWSDPISVLWSKTYHGVKDVYHHFADGDEMLTVGYQERMRYNAPKGMANSSCLSCHEPEDEVYEGRVNIHPGVLGTGKARCVDCHKGLVHWPYSVSDAGQ